MNIYELQTGLALELDRHFPQLVASYQDRLYAFALRLTGRTQEAEDIVQEALLGAYVTLSRYPPARISTLKLSSWLYKITLNTFHSSKRQIPFPMLDISEEVINATLAESEELQPDFLYEYAERSQMLREVLTTIPEQYRVVIICYYFEEMSYQETADLLELPIGTIKSRLHRGLHLLRQAIDKQKDTIYERR